MELKARGHNKILKLLEKGVDIPNPLTLDVGEEVKVDQISGKGVRIYPGCRIYGGDTVITGGAQIGGQGPVTIEDCQIGPDVELKGGYFNKAVFLDKAKMAMGAHVREGCILEEEAKAAHCVGLKHTILFPFVTLGSLINFCDCLMAGGTSRSNHSEVGSSYIHFNFTPEGDKATPSLIGDVPRGVMLNEPPIFLGGQGGIVGPVRLGYGNVVAAGSILRKDFPGENKLIIPKSYRGGTTNYIPNRHPRLSHVLENNIRYLANLMALEQWYIHVRRSFLAAQEFGELMYSGVLHKLSLAKEERIRRLRLMADRISSFSDNDGIRAGIAAGKGEIRDKIHEVCGVFDGEFSAMAGEEHRDRFLSGLEDHVKQNSGNYIQVVQCLPSTISGEGVRWLEQIVHVLSRKTAALIPSLHLFKEVSL